MSGQRPRVALIHPWLLASGGSEPVTLWAAEELKNDYEIEILTMGSTGLDELNAAYGSSLSEPGVRVDRLPVPRWLRARGDAWRGIRLARRVRARAGEFDVLLASYNGMDFGRPGIQYISD
jgi:hypothetical protein